MVQVRIARTVDRKKRKVYCHENYICHDDDEINLVIPLKLNIFALPTRCCSFVEHLRAIFVIPRTSGFGQLRSP